MNSVLSPKIKLLLALTLTSFVATDVAAQTLTKIELTGTKPAARSGHALVNVTGRVFLFGGFSSALPPETLNAADDVFAQRVHNQLFEFDKETGQFKLLPFPSEDQKRLAFAGPVDHNGRFFNFFGITQTGFNDNIVDFDPATNKLDVVTPEGENLPPSRVSSIVVSNGKDIFAIGGQGEDGILDDVHKFVVAGKKWTPLTRSRRRRKGAAAKRRKRRNKENKPKAASAAAEEHELIYLIGGIEDPTKGPTGEILIYDTEEDRWIEEEIQTGQMKSQADDETTELLARAHSAYVDVGDTLYLIGGRGKNNQLLNDIVKVEFKDDDTVTARRLDVRFPAGLTDSGAAILSLTPVAGFEAANLRTVEILIFGGTTGREDTNDAFIFTDIVEVTAPTPDECTGGPEVSSISVGNKTKIKGEGFLEGLFITVNGVGFSKSPVVTPNKITQKGKLTTGQSATEACASGCEFKITTADNRCTKVALP
jgi:Galactose oxidase, central domain